MFMYVVDINAMRMSVSVSITDFFFNMLLLLRKDCFRVLFFTLNCAQEMSSWSGITFLDIPTVWSWKSRLN